MHRSLAFSGGLGLSLVILLLAHLIGASLVPEGRTAIKLGDVGPGEAGPPEAARSMR